MIEQDWTKSTFKQVYVLFCFVLFCAGAGLQWIIQKGTLQTLVTLLSHIRR